MRGWLDALLLFSTAYGVISKVTHLSGSNFTNFIDSNPVTLVKFFAPWCTHCQRIAPEFEEAAEVLARGDDEVQLAEVDGSLEQPIVRKFGIHGFPTLLFFRDGRPQPYSGGRSSESIVQWVQQMTRPPVQWLEDRTALHLARLKHLAEDSPQPLTVFTALFKSKESPQVTLFLEAAKAQRLDGVFMAAVDPEAQDQGKVWAYRHGEETSSLVIDSNEKVEAWIQTESMPLFGPVAAYNYAKYAARSDNWIWFAGKMEDFETSGPIIRRVAANYRKEFNFVWLSTQEYRSHASDGLGLTQFPSIAMMWEDDVYHMEPEGVPTSPITERGLTKFIEAVKAGKVKRFLKSEPLPDSNDDDLKVVVGSEFSDWMLSKDHDTFLMIHAPWCGHCRKMMPLWEELAARTASTGQLVVAKMDGTRNDPDVPGFTISGFPTLYFVAAGSNTPLLYDGDRTMEALLTFAREHAAYPVIDTIDDYHGRREREDL